MPHAWVASDFVRSALDLFAYECDDALVLAAGVPADWFDGDGIGIGTCVRRGPLSFRLRRVQGRVEPRSMMESNHLVSCVAVATGG